MTVGISIGTAFFKTIEEAYEFLKTHGFIEGTCETYIIETDEKNLDILCNRTKQKYRNNEHLFATEYGVYGVYCDTCKVCGGTKKGGLPTSCPGKRLTKSEIELLSQDKIDFIMNKWVII